jgi:hypothetical protein
VTCRATVRRAPIAGVTRKSVRSRRADVERKSESLKGESPSRSLVEQR